MVRLLLTCQGSSPRRGLGATGTFLKTLTCCRREQRRRESPNALPGRLREAATSPTRPVSFQEQESACSRDLERVVRFDSRAMGIRRNNRIRDHWGFRSECGCRRGIYLQKSQQRWSDDILNASSWEPVIGYFGYPIYRHLVTIDRIPQEADGERQAEKWRSQDGPLEDGYPDLLQREPFRSKTFGLVRAGRQLLRPCLLEI